MFMKLSNRDAFGHPVKFRSASTAGITTLAYPVNAANLEGWWAFENSGDVPVLGDWDDASDNTNTGTLIADAFVDSNGLNLDGSLDAVNCGSDSSLTVQNGTNPWTISARFRTTDSEKQHIVSQRNNNGPYDRLIIFIEASGAITGACMDNNVGFLELTSPLTYNDGEWHQATFVRDGSDIILYIDGVSVNSTVNNSSPAATSIPLYIGKENTNLFPFDGNIDDVQVYSRGLGEEEVLANYNARA